MEPSSSEVWEPERGIEPYLLIKSFNASGDKTFPVAFTWPSITSAGVDITLNFMIWRMSSTFSAKTQGGLSGDGRLAGSGPRSPALDP